MAADSAVDVVGLSGFTYGATMPAASSIALREISIAVAGWGVLTSHTRATDRSTREPWEYDEAFVEDYRRMVELKYFADAIHLRSGEYFLGAWNFRCCGHSSSNIHTTRRHG